MAAFFTFVGNHTVFAVLMFAMSLAAATLVVWRLLLNFSARTNLDVFLPRLQTTLAQEGIEGGKRLCSAESGLIPSRLLMAGLEVAHEGSAVMRKTMAHTIEIDLIPRLNYLLPSILAIAKISTMVGLLGTVVSMIGTFQVLGEAAKSSSGGQGAQAQASAEIGLALFATALGLVTAIPLVFSHTLFKAHVHKFETKMKSSAHQLITLVQGLPKGGDQSAPRGAAPAPRVVAGR